MTRDVQIVFEQHFFPHVEVSANPSFKKTQDQAIDAKLNSVLEVNAVSNKPNRYLAELHVTLDDKKDNGIPYWLDVVCLCFMNIEDGPDEEVKKKAAAKLGHKVMFPAIREMVLNITARQPWGAFSIGFSALEEDAPVKKTAAKKKAAPRKGPAKVTVST